MKYSSMLSDSLQVINSTFRAVLPSSVTVPKGLVASLLHRFSTNEGYQLYKDVIPCFQQLKHWRKGNERASTLGLDRRRLHVGIISNSDDRVPAVLAGLGVHVRDGRYGSSTPVSSSESSDIDWVAMSYDVGFEKPNRRIFDAAKSLSGLTAEGNGLYMHVGDNLVEDYEGALAAGWQSLLLDRDSNRNGDALKTQTVPDLSSVLQRLIEGGWH